MGFIHTSAFVVRAQESERAFRNRIAAKISLCKLRIETLHLDAIVNPTNQAFQPMGNGVDVSIHRVAGPELYTACRRLARCGYGEAALTAGYRLPAKCVIHTISPVTQDPGELARCYRNSLEVCVKNNLRTIAFPCIATGVNGFDHEKAANIALGTVRAFLETDILCGKDTIDRVVFCVFSDIDKMLYDRVTLTCLLPRNNRYDF